jgi:hypothetical protein
MAARQRQGAGLERTDFGKQVTAWHEEQSIRALSTSE